MKQFILLIAVAVILASCNLDSYDSNARDIGVVTGYRPIYGDSSDIIIRIGDPIPIEKAGKIYSYQNLLLVNEVGRGIHIYDNSDPTNPINMKYVTIPGNQDVAIKNGVLYADSYSDLVAMKVTEDTLQILKTIPGVMPFSSEFPPATQTYFECVDMSKGIVIGWEMTDIDNPKCFVR